MDILPEVLVVSDSEHKRTNCTVLDLKVGTTVTTFNEGNSVRHGLAFVGQDYVISAFKQQPVMKVWALHQMGSEELNMVMPGLVSCLAVTNSGSYCIAGVDGSIYIWEVSSGSLLTCLQYHSKAVSVIRISSDGSHFVSGSVDGLVLVWLLTDAVGETELSNDVKPRYTLMDHCSEITDIHIGGIGIYARFATASRDMTCRLYELETCLLLVTVHVDYAVTAVIMDELENYLMLGSAEGDIYKINLFTSDETELHYDKANTEFVFKGHMKEVTCLSLSLSGKTLVSGSEDCTCRIWDMDSFSCMKKINFSGTITNAFITTLPPGLEHGQEVKFCPKLNISNFKRQYDKNDEDSFTITRIRPKKLSLFHLGTPDEHFDSQLLINSEETTASFSQSVVTVKDVTNINSQIYSFALYDTISEMAVDSESPEEDLD